MFKHYIVQTTQRRILVAARNERLAVEQVMNDELCPARSILKVSRVYPTKPQEEDDNENHG